MVAIIIITMTIIKIVCKQLCVLIWWCGGSLYVSRVIVGDVGFEVRRIWLHFDLSNVYNRLQVIIIVKINVWNREIGVLYLSFVKNEAFIAAICRILLEVIIN